MLDLSPPPRRISKLANLVTVSQHATDCAFQWLTRDRAVSAPHYRMRNLLSIDRRIEANREGLVYAGDDGWARCRSAFEAGDSGDLFVAALLAFSELSPERMSEVTSACTPTPAGQRALISALAWLPFEPLSPTLGRMARSSSPRVRRVAVRAFALHRRDPFDVLPNALWDVDIEVAIAAARGLGEIKRHDAVPALEARLDKVPESVQVRVAWSLAMLGSRQSLPVLEANIKPGSVDAGIALDMYLRRVDLATGRRFLSRLSETPGTERLIIAATGALGDPSAVPWLIAKMRDPTTNRIAGESFALITGADIGYLDLDGASGPDAVPHPDDDRLPIPDAGKVERWWAEHATEFAKGTRHICGRPISAPSLLTILQTGYQRQRRAAALEWAVSAADSPFFETRQRADRQLRTLDSCS